VAERLLFVTGKLAARALRDTLDRAELPFDYEIAVMKITVAALMTTDWIARFLELPEAITKIMIPGLCEGETDVLAERFGIPVEKGPADLKRLPSWFGQADVRAGYGARDIRVFAEINHVPRLSRDRILELAGYYRDAGADVIDLGLSLDRHWLDEGPAVIAELRERGFALSIDTMDPEEILMADEAGVDYVLSLNGSNRDLAERLRATPVLIPDTPEDLDSLEATIAHVERLGKPYLVDPIIEPIGTGFAASLGRYLEVRRRHPEVEMFMGIGNLTELTEADSTGVNALLIGFCQELGIRNVLTTEVIEWAHGAVRETVLAAQLMHFAQERGTPPKHVDGRLLTVKDEDLRPYAESELRELHAQVTDPNFRIFADGDWIYVFNAELFVKGTDFNDIFDQLGVDEPTHAFYLGKELMKATIARALRKNYRQESPLDWGYMTFEEPRRKRVRLTTGRVTARKRK
jgi:dihydropteroate synthase-like protein